MLTHIGNRFFMTEGSVGSFFFLIHHGWVWKNWLTLSKIWSFDHNRGILSLKRGNDFSAERFEKTMQITISAMTSLPGTSVGDLFGRVKRDPKSEVVRIKQVALNLLASVLEF